MIDRKSLRDMIHEMSKSSLFEQDDTNERISASDYEKIYSKYIRIIKNTSHQYINISPLN